MTLNQVTLAVLDDEECHLELLKIKLSKFNANTKCNTRIVMDTYQSPDDFIKNFNHDIGLIDVNLGGKKNGFEVAAEVFKKYLPGILLINSMYFKEDEFQDDSILSKHGLKISEILSRFWALRNRPNRNVLQIMTRKAEIQNNVG